MDLQKASKYYWYHSVDLGNGVITIGDEQGLPSSTSPGAFEFASGVRKSRVTSKLINVYEMSPSGVRQPKVRSCFCGIHYFAPPRPDPCIRKAVQADQAPLHRGVPLVRAPGCRTPFGHVPGWHHGLGPPELVGDERHVPNRGAALRWIQAGSYRLPIHFAKPVRPISEGTASGSPRGRVGRLARWHGLCERPI